MKPSKEACERAIRWLRADISEIRRKIITHEDGLKSAEEMEAEVESVIAYLRSLHEPCSTCGTVGGGGRVRCPLECDDEADEGTYCPAGSVCPEGYRCEDAGAGGGHCTIPCPECGDGGEG